LRASAGIPSGPAALPFFIFLMARIISSLVGGSQFISMLVFASVMFGGLSGFGLLRSSSKCSAHLSSCCSEFVQKLLQDNIKKLAVSFNHTFRYIDDVLSINNHNFQNYVHLIYPDELEIKDTTESDRSSSYLDILLNIDPNGRLTTSLYDNCQLSFSM
jgi:hypothetical protein